MKKYYLISSLFFMTVTGLMAGTYDKGVKRRVTGDDSGGSGCFDENTHLIGIGIGFGGGAYYKGPKGRGYSYKITPAFSFNYEQAWKPKIGPGYLGVGAYLGFQHASYRHDYVYANYYWNGALYNGNYYYQHTWNYFMIAARGAYHWDVLNAENAEVYGGLMIGMRFQTYAYTTNDYTPYRNDNQLNDASIYPAYSLYAGARWFFVPKAALFAEVGYGISYLTGGVNFKF